MNEKHGAYEAEKKYLQTYRNLQEQSKDAGHGKEHAALPWPAGWYFEV